MALHNSKLIRMLSTLEAKELKRLLPFLKSPYFNSNPNLVKLYKTLRTYHPSYDSRKLSKENIFKKVFPGRKYDYQKLHNLFSDFTHLLEKYLVNIQVEKEEVEFRKILIRSYAERRNSFDIFSKKIIELNQILDKEPYRDEYYFHEKKQLNLQYFGHPAIDMMAEGKEALKLALEYFEASKNMTGIKMKCALNAWLNTVGEKKNILGYDANVHSSSPAFLLYEKLEKFQRLPEKKKDLKILANEFFENINHIRKDDQSNILKMLLNFCGRFINKGETDLIITTFELYKIGLEHECLIGNGKLKESTFHNIVAVGTHVKAFEWTKIFLENYENFLDENIKGSALALGWGQWYFAKKEFNESIESLQFSFVEPYDVFKAKALIVRSYYYLYEVDESLFDLLMAQLEAFEKYTRRNQKISPRVSEGYLKFISFTKKIVRANPEDHSEIKSTIEQEPNLILKSWLLEKLS